MPIKSKFTKEFCLAELMVIAHDLNRAPHLDEFLKMAESRYAYQTYFNRSFIEFLAAAGLNIAQRRDGGKAPNMKAHIKLVKKTTKKVAKKVAKKVVQKQNWTVRYPVKYKPIPVTLRWPRRRSEWNRA